MPRADLNASTTRERTTAAGELLYRAGDVDYDFIVVLEGEVEIVRSGADGSPLVYNLENPYLPDLLICRSELADAALAALASVGG